MRKSKQMSYLMNNIPTFESLKANLFGRQENQGAAAGKKRVSFNLEANTSEPIVGHQPPRPHRECLTLFLLSRHLECYSYIVILKFGCSKQPELDFGVKLFILCVYFFGRKH